MASSCPNCNQSVLPTDTICWHCGYQLTAQSKKSSVSAEGETAVTLTEPFSLSAVMVYSGVTAVLIIALLFSMQSLGQHPLVLLNPDTNVNTGWQPITDQAIQFTLDIPPTWQSFEKANPQEREAFTALLASDEQLATAVTPFSTAISDIEILMIVVSEYKEQMTQLPSFVVMARSEEIGRLTLDETIALAQQNTAITISKATKFESFVGDIRAAITLEMPQTPTRLTCQQHIITSSTDTYIVAGCAPEARSTVYDEPLTKILSSFQTLR